MVRPGPVAWGLAETAGLDPFVVQPAKTRSTIPSPAYHPGLFGPNRPMAR
jgi:hypothetical protein